MIGKEKEPHDRAHDVSTWVRRVVGENGETVDEQTRYAPSKEATIATIMTRTTYCVRPEVGVDVLAALLLEHRMSGVPVVDPDGKPVGVVSKTDVLRHLHEQRDGDGDDGEPKDEEALLAELGAGFHAVHVDGATVRDIMMPIVFALGQDVPIVQAAALLAGEGIHRLPIIDEAGAVCGILSALDIVRWVAEEAGFAV